MKNQAIAEALEKEKIYCYAVCNTNDLRIRKEYLMPKGACTAIIWLMPYFTGNVKGNISLYARTFDYHIISEKISANIIENLKKSYPDARFYNFSDHSPIAEVPTAAAAGLGVMGKNHLLINERYGSFIFVNTVFCDISAEYDTIGEIGECQSCNACLKACPTGALSDVNMDGCLSGITQKKGALSEKEKALIKESGCIWGCDVCQLSCPLNKKAEKTPLDIFYQDRIEFLTKDLLDSMSDEEFNSRAFSWRGKDVLLRNFEIEK